MNGLSCSPVFFLFTDSAFKQQRLPAWQPILTAGTVLPTFFVIGIAFIPVGVILLHVSDQVQEFSTDYTDCLNANNKSCAEVIENPDMKQCECNIPFVLEKGFNVSLFFSFVSKLYWVAGGRGDWFKIHMTWEIWEGMKKIKFFILFNYIEWYKISIIYSNIESQINWLY